MDKRPVNSWSWQDKLGFSQAWRVDGARSVIFISGQAPISASGELVGEGDFEAQTRQVFENLRAVLDHSGGSFESIVKLTVYLRDPSRLREYGRIKAEYIPGSQPASTAIGVAGLALPGMLIEVEAIAVV